MLPPCPIAAVSDDSLLLPDASPMPTNPDEPPALPRPKHRYSSSVDALFPEPIAEPKKAMSADKLAELAVIDPKRAKRIMANRQSAARSKERKARYIAELQRRVQILQIEATTLSAQLALFQRDTSGLTTENEELRLQLQVMEQQSQLCDAMNEALKQEVDRLRIATGEMPKHGENFTTRELQNNPYNQPFITLAQQQAGLLHNQNVQPNIGIDHQLPTNPHDFLDIMQDDHFEILIGSEEIGKASLFIKSESCSLSASESSGNF
ncbi:putative transcription factor bZIP family [Dioscorea sansibarensis]